MPPSTPALLAALAAAVLSACSSSAPRAPSSASAERPDAPLAPVTSAQAARLPGPAPRHRPEGHDPASANAGCAGCHTEIAAEWASSMHRQAWRDPVFQKAYAIEAVAFCRGCHAPEADPAADPPAAAQEVGVGCTTCHVQAGGEIAGAGRRAPGASGAHPVLADPRLATTEACASCHQFDFPGERAPMQDTVREHARSRFAGEACQSCHMPEVAPAAPGEAPHRSHAFAVMKSPDMLRRAASVSARRSGPRAIEIAIAPSGAGHAFPTGDMFRRIEIRAEAVRAAAPAPPPRGERNPLRSGDGVEDGVRVVARAAPAFLGRTFADTPRSAGSLAFHRIERADTRVPPPGDGEGEARVVALRFDQPVGGAMIRWRVAYQRMATAMAASFGVDQALDEVVIAAGELAPDGGE